MHLSMPSHASGVNRSCLSGASRAAVSLEVGRLLGRPFRALLMAMSLYDIAGFVKLGAACMEGHKGL